MRIFRNCLLSLFIISSIGNLAHAQDPCYYQECDSTGEAYAQSSYNCHWSAFVPLALIVGAAIWFGVADGNSSNDSSSDSKNGLGSLARSRRSSSYHSSRSHGSHSSGCSNSYSGHY